MEGVIRVFKRSALFASMAVFMLVFYAGSASKSLAEDYRLGEGDLIKIMVYDHPDLTTETRVSGDGKVSFSLVGEITVDGLTATGVEKKITRLLSEGYIVDPHVSVFIVEYKSKKVTAMGEFNKPGLVELRGNFTLLEVISSAGGVTRDAGESLIIQRKIIRGRSGKEEEVTVNVDLKKLLEDGDVAANVYIQDGDSVYVPRAAFVYVNGEVRTPGAYKITKGLTVLKAITLAGGFTPKAAEGRTKILRKTDKGEITLRVAMDELVQADDVVLVPESIF